MEALPRQDRKTQVQSFDLSVANSSKPHKAERAFQDEGFPLRILSLALFFIFVILAEGWIWTRLSVCAMGEGQAAVSEVTAKLSGS